VIQRAQKGYDYAQLVEKHKQRETSLTEKEKSLQGFAEQWQPYIDYANKNPQWADHVRSSWETAANPTAQPPNAAAAPSNELQEIKSFIENYKQERVLAQQAQEDSALSAQVEEIRKAHPEIDFGASDPATGETLEFKILK
jgi:hypothetical protein